MNHIILLSSCFVAVIADMLFVWWAKKETHPTIAVVVALILCNIAGLIWAYSMRKGIESATAITFYALLTVAGCSFLGFVVFKEPITLTNGIGLCLAVIALILISIH